MGSLVTERELGLRLALVNAGLRDSAYWASWVLFDAAFSALVAALILVFGASLFFWFVACGCFCACAHAHG